MVAGMQAGRRWEIPWWTYGARGMQLWFPSSLAEPVSPGWQQSLAEDPELEFDREVYPVGISLSDVSVIGAPITCPTPSQQPCLNLNYHHPGLSCQTLCRWYWAHVHSQACCSFMAHLPCADSFIGIRHLLWPYCQPR